MLLLRALCGRTCRFIALLLAAVAAGCSTPSDPATTTSAPAPTDGDSETPTVLITVDDDQTYISTLEYAPDRLLVQIIPGSLADAAALAGGAHAQVQSYDAATRTAVLRVASADLAST